MARVGFHILLAALVVLEIGRVNGSPLSTPLSEYADVFFRTNRCDSSASRARDPDLGSWSLLGAVGHSVLS